MSIINYYNSPTVINWNLDEFGKPVSPLIQNETKQVVDGKIPLEGLPDEQYRIQITGYVEINIKDIIDSPDKFKCDYTHGVLYFDQSKNGVSINIDRYYSRGQFYIPSSRVWTKLSEDGSIEETLKDVEGKLDVAKNLSNEIQAEENIRIQNENIRQQQEGNRQVDTVASINAINDTNLNFKIWEDYDNLKLYKPLNKVQYQGSSYVNILECQGVYPTNTLNWQLVASKGADGLGAGDMLKATYDANNNGKVDVAENAEKLEGRTLAQIYADIPEGTTVVDSTINGNILVNGSEIQVYNDTDVIFRNNDLDEQIANIIPLDADLLAGQNPSYYATKQSVDNLAGVGRTTETVKGIRDELVAHKAESVSQGNPHGIDAKANKVQENWITPSFLNGWINAFACQYRKNELGMIELKGTIMSGTATKGTLLFALPVGYRPYQLNTYVAAITTNDAGVIEQQPILVDNNGVSIAGKDALAYINLHGITFFPE